MGFFNKRSKRAAFEHIDSETSISAEEIGVLLSEDMANIELIRGGANNGNLNCQVFLSNADLHYIIQNEENPTLPSNVVTSLYKSFEHFTTLAAEQGHADSQYNLAKFYLMQANIENEFFDEDDFDAVKKAQDWYERARESGYENLEQTISNLAEVLELDPRLDTTIESSESSFIEIDIEQLINSDGIDRVTSQLAETISGMLESNEVAFQFVLEEIEAASQGNDAAKKFSFASGIEPWEYEGAMENSHSAIDGGGGPQQTLVTLSMQLRSDPDLMIEFRTMIVDKIMKKFGLGRYADNSDELDQDEGRLVNIVDKDENSMYGVFVNINNDLGDFIERNEDCDDLHKMAYGYARRTAAAGMYAQGIFNRAQYNYVSQIFRDLQQSTGQTVEFQEDACDQALELIESYTDLLDRESLNFMVALVENGLDNSFLGGEPQDLMKTVEFIDLMKEKYTTSK